MEDDTLGGTEGSKNVSLRVGDSSSQQDAGTPVGPIARSGQDAETESQDPYAVLRPNERPPPVLYQGIGPCSRPVRARHVSRQDPLLKPNHANVMEVPGSCEIRVVPKAPYDFIIQNGKLAMEIPRGQKFIQTQRGSTGKSFRSNRFLGSFKDKGYVSDLARQSTLRGHGMSNFLVRISTVMSLLDSPVEIRENSIQFSMETEFCEFSPELEDHFEIFEHIRGFNVTIVTSANTQDETLPPWSGFLQKDEGETQGGTRSRARPLQDKTKSGPGRTQRFEKQRARIRSSLVQSSCGLLKASTSLVILIQSGDTGLLMTGLGIRAFKRKSERGEDENERTEEAKKKEKPIGEFIPNGAHPGKGLSKRFPGAGHLEANPMHLKKDFVLDEMADLRQESEYQSTGIALHSSIPQRKQAASQSAHSILSKFFSSKWTNSRKGSRYGAAVRTRNALTIQPQV
ncbi:hypothetical protein EZV62_028247 [Acer yangbiense]|uniref:Ribosomal protein L5 n=1 Tax=Acer yangbiense TaxID=1000413 RepID=A0A5C7GPT8_9ROSI|nr:hypothetical protein EZV62_028247 [Acer yangbiense]